MDRMTGSARTLWRRAGRLAGIAVALAPVLAAVAVALAGAGAGAAAHAAPPAAQLVSQAVRTLPGRPVASVTLPEYIAREPGETSLQPVYEIHADLGPAPRGAAVYVPGVLNRARVQVNGHTLVDALREPGRPGPRGPDRLLYASIPDEWLRAGTNTIAITLAAPRWTSLSPVWVGPQDELRAMHASKRWWQIYAPVVAAAVIFALSVCVLLLWLRRRGETLYAYFGVGGVVWALHNVWAVLPDPLLPYPHFAVWWNLGFGFFVAPIVVFCVRLAQWRVPRLERALWLALAVGPVFAYSAHAFGALDTALMLWRLGWVGVVAVGLLAVATYAWTRRDLHAWLLLAAAAAAFSFGLTDWLLSVWRVDNNPVALTHFSGLVFFPLVASMLIDGFVRASRGLEQLNAELEQRVAQQGAELRSALDAMRDAKDRAQAADRAKSSFLAAASHDLRQPMHSLGLYMAALGAEASEASRVELVARMQASVESLDTLFDALLDVSRIDAGAVEPRPCVFALEPLLHRLAADFAGPAADKGLRLSVRIANAARHMNARSDPVLVERIVRNLLGNAVKYTEVGGVLLALRLRATQPEGGPQWHIEVWDSGPGIAPAEQDRVFEEFYQLGNPERNRAAGLGLGLSIVRRLTRLLGHGLALRSRPGRGTRFRICLPATDEAVDAPPARAPLPLSARLDRLGVAVVDDDPDVRDSMTALLSRWGCDVVAGASGEEVLARAGPDPARRLHAAVVDHQLRGGLDGIEAIRTLRRACGATLPVLMVSGTGSPERLAEVVASGHPWLAKPVPVARLRSWLAGAAAGADA